MKRNPNFILNEIDSEYIIIPIGQEAITVSGVIKVNEIGAFIFNVLENEVTQQQIVDAILAAYNAPTHIVEKDVADFLEELRKYNII